MKKLTLNLFIIPLLYLLTFLSISAQPSFTVNLENPVISKGISADWDKSSLWWPNVSFIQDTFYLTYLGTDNFPNSPLSVGLATSTDGYNFTKHPTPILQANGSDIELFSVSNGPLLKSGETWQLYYNGISTDPSDPGRVIAKANSPSPYGPWERENDTLLTVGESGEWDDAFVLPLSIIKNNEELVMYYCGGDIWPNPFGQIGMATSNDNGTTWEKYEGNPILSPGPENYDNISIFGASIIKTGNKWEIFYTGASSYEFAVCYANSKDGITWTKHGVILSPFGDPLAVDLYEGPSVVRNTNGYFLYFDYGLQQEGIGLATAESLSGIIDVPNQFSTIQSAIDAATNGDTVLVAEGTYLENINFKGKAITVASHFILDQDTSHVSKTIIDGSQPTDPNKGSVVTFDSGEDTTSVICGFTITGGSGTLTNYVRGGGILVYFSGAKIINNVIEQNSINAPGYGSVGGGICCRSDTTNRQHVIIDNNKIKYNKAHAGNDYSGFGGGIDVWGSDVQLLNNHILYNQFMGEGNFYGTGIRLVYSTPKTLIQGNTISFNTSGQTESKGGGLYFVVTNSVKISSNKIEGNSAKNGGGGLYDRGSKNNIFSKNTISNNISEQFGGGIYLEESDLKIFNNKIKQNQAILSGGGIYFNKVSKAEVNNNLIASNNAILGGGGIALVNNSHPDIINNTIVENTSESGGGISLLMNSDPIIMNTILYGNKADSNGNQLFILTEDCEPTFTYCDIEGGIADFGIFANAFPFTGTYENNIDSNPLFADTDSFYIPTNSPCVNAGNPDVIYNDPDGSRNDIGCYGGPKLLTSIKEIISVTGQLPSSYNLSQNYPNPFNPATRIQYTIPVAAQSNVEVPQVSLKIFDILGREVATLVNQKQNPGNYEITWDGLSASGGQVPSGVYFYQLTAGDPSASSGQGFIETKKMLLLR